MESRSLTHASGEKDLTESSGVTREHVDMLMRPQDAELLESVNVVAANATPLLGSQGRPKSTSIDLLPTLDDDKAEDFQSNSQREQPCPKQYLSGEAWSQSSSDAAPSAQNKEGKNPPSMQRSFSLDRRLSEAAQFAEAVGDEQEKDRIIVEDDDDDDDDEDDLAPEVHVEPSAPDLKEEKCRPQWPFQGGSKRLFMHKLPVNGCQDFVYKGLQSNPPEIVKRGTTRGNYAQLHRKAWLEVSDKYHRYGKNLRLYYRHWEQFGCPTNMFFDWLDSKGEAAGQPLPELEECPRSQLDSDTVLYINNPDVTNGYRVAFGSKQGKGLVIDVDGEPVVTGVDGWIFVLRDNEFYAAKKVTSVSGHSKQRFHHSSFFSGKAVAAAGIFITDDKGYLSRLYPHSGHYRPGEADMQRLLFFLHRAGVDLRTFEVDMQQILHVTRDKVGKEEKCEKKKKVESIQLVSAVSAACFLAHKARFIGEGIYVQIQKIRKSDATSVSEALRSIN